MALHQPLDLEYWLINVFSGSIEIFVVVSLFIMTSMAGFFKMSNLLYGMFIILFSVILAANGFNAILILAILVLAPILFWWIRRIVE
jgi:hypothetical protein